MFCYQCEQTAKGEACTEIGVCGKQPDVAALQDLLNYAVKGLSQIAVEGRKVGSIYQQSDFRNGDECGF
jgi:hydroxylamine reductase